jgi:hypothetical protein
MPIARFQMPDGQIGRFEVPEGTSPEDAQTLIQQHLSGSTQAKTNPFMDLLKEQASQVKELFPQNAEEKAKLQAKLGNINPQEYYNIAQGFMPATGVGKVANQLFPNIAETVAAKGRTIPEWLMQTALKPTLEQLKSGKAQTAVQTLLQEGINPTMKGVEQLKSKIGDINTEISNILSSYKGNVNKSDVLSRINDVRAKFTNQATPTADLNAIDNAVNDFITSHPEKIPVELAQKIKQGTYKVLSGKFGEQGSAAVESQKALARGLKEEIATKVPEISSLNAKESKLIDTLNVTERRALMDLNKNPAGLSLLANDPAAAAGFMADKSALAKSLLARMIYNVQKVPAKIGGLLENKVPSVMTPNNPEVIIPNILKGMGLLSSQDNQ